MVHTRHMHTCAERARAKSVQLVDRTRSRVIQTEYIIVAPVVRRVLRSRYNMKHLREHQVVIVVKLHGPVGNDHDTARDAGRLRRPELDGVLDRGELELRHHLDDILLPFGTLLLEREFAA